MSEPGAGHLATHMERGNVFEPACPSRTILRHLTSTWGTLALIALKAGTLRFSELRRRVNGVSERMLSQTLQQLEADGLIVRTSYPVVPPRVDYALTELGRQAADRMEELTDWIENNLPALMRNASVEVSDERA